MCLKKVYYNTYADGAQDIVEQLYPCREGRTHAPEIRKYEQKFAYDKPRDGLEPRDSRRLSSRFLGDLPTPRRSKSPSPLPRRDSTHISGDLPSPSKHHGRRDRRDHHRRSSIDYPPSPRLTRSSTMSTPHVVVIDQDQSRFKRHDVDLGPVHIVDERPVRRHSTRRHTRRDTEDAVVINDERERRRHEREKRRMSTTIPDILPAAPPAPDVHPAIKRRSSLRRAATVVQDDGSNTSGASSAHVHWEDKVRRARDKQNAEIANRRAPPEVHQPGTSPKAESGLKGILKRATSDWRTKDLKSETSDLRRAVEKMDLPKHTGDDLDLWDRDRLRARFGSDDGEGRRRRTSKVWTGDRYEYL